jgi:WD40 repeat protein
MMRRYALLLLLTMLVSCSSRTNATNSGNEDASTDPSYGYSQDNPIRVGGGPDHGPWRERWFFDHLRDADGQPISYERKGSCCEEETSSNPYESTALDIYEVSGPGLKDPIELYIDMYTCDRPMAPHGFSSEGMGATWDGDIYFMTRSALLEGDLSMRIYHLDSETNCLNRLSFTEVPYLHFDVSPDGEWIAYSKVIEDSMLIFSARIDGTEERQLTDPPAWDSSPVWSPDGQSVVFMRDNGDEIDLYMVGSDGSDLIQLTSGPSINMDPAWSPDGSEIAYSGDPHGSFEIYVLTIETEEIQRLTNSSDFDAGPAWSPSGEELVFMSERETGIHLFLIPESGGEANPLTSGTGINAFPVWSPDGDWIAYCSVVDEYTDISIMNVEDGEVQQLTEGASSDCFPVWVQD